MAKDMKIHIVSLQWEVIAQYRWDTQVENYSLVINIDEPVTPTHPYITRWDGFFQELRHHFYP
jgi:hypothetical protein